MFNFRWVIVGKVSPGKIIACLIIGVKSSLPVYSVYSKVSNLMGMACQMVRGETLYLEVS